MKFSIIIVTILSASIVFGVFSTENTLEDLKWKKNVIMLFPQSAEVEMAFTDSVDLKMQSRELVWFVISDSLYSNTALHFSEEYIGELKTRYLLGSKSSCWVLLGKDGGLKIRKEEQLDWDRIIATVDSIPFSNGDFIWE